MSRLSETFAIGALEVAALSDGAPDRELSGFFSGVDPAEWTRAIGVASPSDPVPFNFGSFLIRGGGPLTLVDTGFGPPARAMGVPGGGGLLDRLAELGVAPADVEAVVHTHLHGDHVGWNVDDDRGDALVFTNAAHYVARAEIEYWTGPEADANPLAAEARRRIGPPLAAGRVEAVEGEYAVTGAVTMIPTPGHTPGHCSVLAASGGEHLLLLGDAAHHPVHLERHDWLPGVDLDKAASSRSRAKLARLAAERGAVVSGGHFPILTLGRVRETGDGGYRWEPL